MSKFNFQSNQKEAEKKYNLGKGEYFKVQEGRNIVRLVSACLPHESVYKGNTTFKWLCQIIDDKDGKVKPYFMPHRVYQMIGDLQLSEDYAFEEVPMPYKISINAQGAGTKEVKYSVTPSRNNSEMTAEEQQALKDAPTVQELQDKVIENSIKEQGATTKEEAATQINEVDGSDIPF